MTDTVSKSAITPSLSVLERVSDFRWASQAVGALAFLDLVLLGRTGSNLLDWSAHTEQLIANSGLIVLGVVGYSVIASMVLPVMSTFLREILIQVSQAPHMGWVIGSSAEPLQVGYVSGNSLREHGLVADDKTAREVYKEHEEANRQALKENFRFERQIFLVLTALLANAYAARWVGSGQSVLVEAGATEQGWFAAIFAVFCLVLGVLQWMCWFNTSYRTQVYYPPLYRKQEEERRARAFP